MLNQHAKETVLLRKNAVAYRQHTAPFVARRALRALTDWPFQSYFSKGNGVTAPFRGGRLYQERSQNTGTAVYKFWGNLEDIE
jgi:hypothetical protein